MLLRRKARANTPLKKIKRHVGTTQGGSAGQYLMAAAEPATEKMVKAFKTSWNTPDAQRIQEEGGVTLSIPWEVDGVPRGLAPAAGVSAGLLGLARAANSPVTGWGHPRYASNYFQSCREFVFMSSQ